MIFLIVFVICIVSAIQAAMVTGVVKENDSSGSLISGATVTLTQRGGVGISVTAATDAAGVYSFANVAGSTAAPVTYRIAAAKTGFRTSAGVASVLVNNATGTFTRNLYLIPTAVVGMFSVSGTVSDSAAGSALTPLAGARIILNSLNAGGSSGTAIDTVTSAADGSYKIDSISVGVYSLAVSAANFVAQTANLMVARANTVQNFKLLHSVTASITGTVIDSVTTTGVGGAKVYLRTRNGGLGGGANIDSTVTAAGGAYTLASVPSSSAGVNYIVKVSKSGYVTSNVNVAVTGTTAQTVNVKLVPILMASITGTVTDSSSAGVVPVAGVKITLRTAGGGGRAMVIDSTVTASNGGYTLSDVASSAPYVVRAEAAGYVTANSIVNVPGTSAQTVNFRLVKTPKGNLIISVKKRVDSMAISGASVTAIIGTTILTGTTGTNGLAVFPGVLTGMYDISISAADYTAIGTNTMLTPNVNDTITIYLAAATGGTKMLTGAVKDSAGKAALTHVAVELVIQGGGYGGGTLVLVDSTDANGNYAFVGIPRNRNSGRITATLAGYRPITNTAVAIGAANQADTTTLNLTMLKIPAAVISFVNHAPGEPDFSITPWGVLRLSAIGDGSVVKVIGMDGRLLYQSRLNAGTTYLSIPTSTIQSGNFCIVSLTLKNAVYRKQVMMP